MLLAKSSKGAEIKGKESKPEFTIAISAKDEYQLGEEITLKFELTNQTGVDHYVLKWNTPLEGIRKDNIFITTNGHLVPYDGILVKRGNPVLDNYIHVPAGQSVTTSVDLSIGYEMGTLGDYIAVVHTSLVDVIPKEANVEFQPRAKKLHKGSKSKLLSNTIKFTIIEGSLPRRTLGYIQRNLEANENLRYKSEEKSAQSDVRTVPKFIGGNDSDRAVTLKAHNFAFDFISANIKELDANVNGNSHYVTWFGSFDQQRFLAVQVNFMAMYYVLRDQQMSYNFNGQHCDASTFAYTFYNSRTIFLCGEYLKAALNGEDSKIGTIIHELGHCCVHSIIDIAYSRPTCLALASSRPADAINNADNYEYFTETQPCYTKLLGIGIMSKNLWTRATLIDKWVKVENSSGNVIGITTMNDGVYLGIGTSNGLWTRATLNDSWVEAPKYGKVIAVTIMPDGTILGVGMSNGLWTRATLNDKWVEAPKYGKVIGVTVMLDGTILGIGMSNGLWTRATLNDKWVEAPKYGKVIGVTIMQDGSILGIGMGNGLWTRATINDKWVEVPDSGDVIAVTSLPKAQS